MPLPRPAYCFPISNANDEAVAEQRTSSRRHYNGSHRLHHRQNSKASTCLTRTQTPHQLPATHWQSSHPWRCYNLRNFACSAASRRCEDECCSRSAHYI